MWSFTTAGVPNPTTPSSPSPSNNATNVATSGTFSWSTSANDGGSTLNYDLYLGTSSSNLSLYDSGKNSKSCAYSGLKNSQTYYWKVVVYNGSGGHSSSPVWSFTTASAASAPDLTIAGGSYFNTSTLTTGKAYTFAIKVKNNGSSAWNGSFYLKNGSEDWLSWGGITIEAGATKTLTDSYTPKSAGSKTLTLYYQTGNSGSGVTVPAGSYENPFKVTVADAPVVNPTTPYSPSPSQGATGVATSGTFSWSTAANDGGSTLNYDLYVDYNSSFSNVSKPYGSGSGKSCSFSGLSEGKTYYWKVIVYNGSGGHATSPVWSFTTKTASTTKLATPRNLTATSVTSSGFIANWSSVSGATIYDCYVYKSGESNICFYRSVATTSTDVFGLSPNTSYIFKVRARNGNSSLNSDWSSMSSTVKTSSAGSQAANLTIFKNNGLANSATITVGQSSHYSVIVKNNGSETWKGSFYLKEGDTDIHPWYGNSIPSTWGQPLECDYTPKTVGSHTLTLYYQTGGRGDGVPMGSITVKAVADPTVNSNLKLKSAIVYPSSIALGKKGTISATVQNTGSDNWNGKLFLADNGIEIASVEDIASGGTKTVYTASWEPQTAGMHTIAVYYQSDGGSGKQLVAANGFANQISISVIGDNQCTVAEKVNVEHVTETVVPNAVPSGARVLYHFRITNNNGIPMRGVSGEFDIEVTSTSGTKRNYTFTSAPSGANGLIVLAIHTDDISTVINSGESAVIKCKRVFSNGVDFNIQNSDKLKSISLKVKSDAPFSKIESFELTLDAGASAKLSAGEQAIITDPFSEDKEIAALKAGITFPVTYSLNKNDYGKISEIGIECAPSASASASAGIGEWLTFDTEGYIGIKNKNTFSADDKRAIWMAVANGLEAFILRSNWVSLVMERAFCTWFHKKQLDIQSANSWFVGYQVGADAKLSKTFPAKVSKLLDKLTLPKSFILEPSNMFNIGAKANVKWEPDKYKTMGSGAPLYGESRSIKLKASNFMSSLIPELILDNKSYWNESSVSSYYSHFGLDYLLSASAAKQEAGFTIMEEEFYEDINKQYLYSLSNKFDITTSTKIGLNDLPVIGTWLNKKAKADISHTFTLSSKIESKGEFAKYIQSISRTPLGATTNRIFPVLLGESIIGAPKAHYEIFKDDLARSLCFSHIGNNVHYPLQDALKFEQKVKSEVEANVSIPFHPGNIVQTNIDARMAFACESYPSESYFSVQDKQFLPVVLMPSSSIRNEIDELTSRIKGRLNGSFNDAERAEIDDAYYWETHSAQYGTGYVANITQTYTYDDWHYSLQSNDWLKKRIRKIHPRLAASSQNKICKMTFTLNEDVSNFDSDATTDFMHFYPAGQLLGITDNGDTLFVVSEVCNLTAKKAETSFGQTQYGKMKLETTIGADDLTPFGFREDQPLDVFYSEEGSEIWHYLGPAGTTLYTDKLGAYMMATSIKNDPLAPVVEATLNDDAYILHIHVSDNIAVRTSSLRVYINGEAREVTMLSESDFEVQLTSKDMDYMMTVFVTANDLAGNQGRLFQMFNMDKPDSIEQIEDGNDVDNTQIHLSKNMLKVENAEPGITVSLFSLKGEMIAKGETDGFGKAQIRLAHLPAGIYVATLSNGKAKKFSVK